MIIIVQYDLDTLIFAFFKRIYNESKAWKIIENLIANYDIQSILNSHEKKQWSSNFSKKYEVELTTNWEVAQHLITKYKTNEPTNIMTIFELPTFFKKYFDQESSTNLMAHVNGFTYQVINYRYL